MLKKILPADCLLAPETHTSAQWPLRWKSTALAAAVLLAATGSNDAHALALGQLTVQSALGEPLQAQIQLPEATAAELASLRTEVAPPSAYKTAGMEYNTAANGVRISVQRRPDGSAYLQLRSDRSFNEPFLDLILEVSWSAGRIVRDYTLLFDPPSSRQAAAPVTLPQARLAPATSPAPAPSPSNPIAVPPVVAPANDAAATPQVTANEAPRKPPTRTTQMSAEKLG